MNTPHYYSPIPDRSATKAVPLFGYYVQMLVEGYGWNGAREIDLIGVYDIKADGTNDYRKKSPYAVDLSVSNQRTTGTLVAGMRQKFWSLKQVEAALLDPKNIGGAYVRAAYARSSARGEQYLVDLYEGSFTANERDEYMRKQVPNTPSPGRSIRNLSKNSWKVDEDGYTYAVESSIKIIGFLARTGPATANEVQRSGAISGRAAAKYVDALALAGMVTISREKHLCKDGKRYLSKVVRLASVEVAEAVLLASDMDERVRTLWEWVATFQKPMSGFTGDTNELLMIPQSDHAPPAA